MARLSLATPRISTIGALEGIKFARDEQDRLLQRNTELLNQRILQQRINLDTATFDDNVAQVGLRNDVLRENVTSAQTQNALDMEFGRTDRLLDQNRTSSQITSTNVSTRGKAIANDLDAKYGDQQIQSDLDTAAANRANTQAMASGRMINNNLDYVYGATERQAGITNTQASTAAATARAQSSTNRMATLEQQYTAAIGAGNTELAQKLLEQIKALSTAQSTKTAATPSRYGSGSSSGGLGSLYSGSSKVEPPR